MITGRLITDVNRLAHTYGPLDGSLYAKVVKSKTPPPAPSSVQSGRSSGSHVTFSDHSPSFVNSPHVASTDSGISSAGVGAVRAGSSSNQHSGSSSSSSVDPPLTPPTPSPVRLSDQRKMPSIVETPAPSHDVIGGGSAPCDLDGADTAELDQLLSGMLMNVQNIRDIRPSQRQPDIDVDSIQVNFDLSCDTVDRSAAKKGTHSTSKYIYESDTVRRAAHPATVTSSAAMTKSSAHGKEIPYHARKDSKPFTYGLVADVKLAKTWNANENGVVNGNVTEATGWRNRKDSVANGSESATKGLESPSLVRKLSGGGSSPSSPTAESNARSAPRIPVPSLSISPRPLRKLSDTLVLNATPSTPLTAPAATSSPRIDVPTTTISLEDGIQDISTSSDASSKRWQTEENGGGSTSGLSWLQRQQEKLRERKDSVRRSERRPHEARLISELRTAQQVKGQQQQHHHLQQQQRPGDDGYLSDVTLFSELNTSREGSPDIRNVYATPLHINTATSYNHYQQAKPVAMKPMSNPGSPLLAHRSTGLEGNGLYTNTIQQLQQQQQQQQQQQTETTTATAAAATHRMLTRQKSDMSHDRERPFVALKRAHQQQQSNGHNDGLLSTVADSDAINAGAAAQTQTQPQPIGRLGNLERLIKDLNTNLPDPAALMRQPNQLAANKQFFQPMPEPRQLISALTDANHGFPKEDSLVWSTPMNGEDASNRPETPGFPVVPRTPYLNVHRHQNHHESPSTTPIFNQSGAGLPPKSPTAQRRIAGLASSFSPVPSTAKTLRKWPSNTSVSSKERSPSPSLSSPYLGGGQSSRRSSVQSVGALSDPQEVSPVHVSVVKDTSRFWYQPNIAREEAINMLKEQVPGTFIVRDSNSFPGAFGLALKVATPPPHAANKNGADPAVELVRHFLIEPTSKGVRIKGCSNEPVFGSLSALIYQHSVSQLALPTKLILPESDAMRSSTAAAVNPVAQLLTQGAACSLLYLFTMDTESLTGPQAIQRTMTHLLDARPLPTATVVHFKVSAQGITLTDNERKLFFRRHYPVTTVSYCGLDPEDRRWNQRSEETGLPVSSNRCFGFIARKPASKTDNQCHIFAEVEAEQPATAIVNFVTKVMMTSSSTASRNNV